MHLPPIPRFLARWTIRAVLFFVFICLPAAIIYLREVGVGYGLKERVAGALSGEGFRTEIGKLSIDPFQGLIAQNVEVKETSGDAGNLARVERLIVSVNFTDLLSGRFTIDHVRLDETDVSVPIGTQPDSPRLSANGVSAELYFAGDQMRISSFEGQIQGVNVVLSGSLQNPRAFHLQPPDASQNPRGRQDLLSQVIETLSTLKFPSRSAGTPRRDRRRPRGPGDAGDFSNFAALRTNRHSKLEPRRRGSGSRLRESSPDHQTIEGARFRGVTESFGEMEGWQVGLRTFQRSHAGTLSEAAAEGHSTPEP